LRFLSGRTEWEAMTFPLRSRVRLVLGVVGAVAVLLVLARVADLAGHIDRCVGFFRAAGPWPFFAAMALLPIFGFPVWPFTAAAGPVFGPTLGVANVILCALLAVAANLAVSYWLSARALRPWVERGLTRKGYSIPRIPAGAEWEIALLVRLIPGPPFFLQSYLLGVARVPFRIYMMASLAVLAVFIAGTVLSGEALIRGDMRGLAFGGAVCGVAAVVVYRLRRRLKRAAQV
jgi:uncharacterized membrane protein YdjX (TVP38/TMEM64 family)